MRGRFLKAGSGPGPVSEGLQAGSGAGPIPASW